MRKTALPTALLWGLISPLVLASEALDIGSQKQLFIDDYIVESMEPKVYRLMNQARKYHGNPVIRLDQDWEHKGGLSHGGDCGQIFWDPDRKVYRFYDLLVNWDWSERWVFYAESKDGIHWVKPKLGQVKYLGFDTNFIRFPFDSWAHSNAIFRDPVAQSESERYKMLYMKKKPDGKVSMYPGYSSDGLNWEAYDVDRPAVPYWSDTNNNLLWDAPRKRYVLYLRTFNNLTSAGWTWSPSTETTHGSAPLRFRPAAIS